MARYTGPQCRLCRREGQTLHLRGKCALDNRQGPPGEQHGSFNRQSEYGRQLREKQLVKRVYGVLENQFRNTFEEAERQSGKTGENLLVLMERRLDSAITRLGLAWTRRQGRQYVNHGHVLVNGETIDIPSYRIEPGDNLELKDRMKDNEQVVETMSITQQTGLKEWLTHTGRASGRVVRNPEREEIDEVDIDESLIVEFYSK
ncbi:MAG: 30S ribosomal protein S4 [bacterium]